MALPPLREEDLPILPERQQAQRLMPFAVEAIEPWVHTSRLDNLSDVTDSHGFTIHRPGERGHSGSKDPRCSRRHDRQSATGDKLSGTSVDGISVDSISVADIQLDHAGLRHHVSRTRRAPKSPVSPSADHAGLRLGMCSRWGWRRIALRRIAHRTWCRSCWRLWRGLNTQANRPSTSPQPRHGDGPLPSSQRVRWSEQRSSHRPLRAAPVASWSGSCSLARQCMSRRRDGSAHPATCGGTQRSTIVGA